MFGNRIDFVDITAEQNETNTKTVCIDTSTELLERAILQTSIEDNFILVV